MGAIEPDPAVLTEVAARVAAEAADLVRTARADISAGRGVAVDTKTSDTDVVTAVDHDSERFVRRRLAELRPGDPVLGEEGGGEVGTESAEGSAAVTWVVDPIDGTVNFLYGFPVFAVSVAAQVGGVSVAGAVVEPVSGRRWTATRGAGAWLDGEPLRVSRPAGLDQALLATGFAYQVRRRARQARLMAGVLEHVRDIRRAGAASLDLCAVAAGWHDAYFEHGLNRWDWAAGALIAAEAGAVVSLPGEDPQLGADATLAASPAVASALRAVLVDCGAADV